MHHQKLQRGMVLSRHALHICRRPKLRQPSPYAAVARARSRSTWLTLCVFRMICLAIADTSGPMRGLEMNGLEHWCSADILISSKAQIVMTKDQGRVATVWCRSWVWKMTWCRLQIAMQCCRQQSTVQAVPCKWYSVMIQYLRWATWAAISCIFSYLWLFSLVYMCASILSQSEEVAKFECQ